MPRIIPILICISPGNDLDWFNHISPDPTYFEQIIESLQNADEWPVLQMHIERKPDPREKKKDKVNLCREVQ
jgi:hypothetical protein